MELYLMKRFDIKVDINENTYMDEYNLMITEDKKTQIITIDTNELLDLYNEVKHAVETNIC